MMQRAFELAARGCHSVSPNPMVGCVIVKDGHIIAEGWHECPGGPHAEAAALSKAGDAARGADLYVTLEPCCHYGRTPPCTEKIIAAGILRVVAAAGDPNPLVAGKGLLLLQEAGIDVSCGLLKTEAYRQNEIFFKYIKTGLPFVTIKLASSLDGKSATASGESKWITCEESRREVHRLRARHKAMLTGIGTILADNPLLSVRLENEENAQTPIRVIADPLALTPPDAAILGTLNLAPVIVAVTPTADKNRISQLIAKGCQIIECPEKNGLLDLNNLLAQLGARGIDSLFVEAGGRLAGSVITDNLADRCVVFMAPLFMGADALNAAETLQSNILDKIKRYSLRSCSLIGTDVMLDIAAEAYDREAKPCSQE